MPSVATHRRTWWTITARQRADVLFKLVQLAMFSYQPRSAALRDVARLSDVRLRLYQYAIRD